MEVVDWDNGEELERYPSAATLLKDLLELEPS